MSSTSELVTTIRALGSPATPANPSGGRCGSLLGRNRSPPQVDPPCSVPRTSRARSGRQVRTPARRDQGALRSGPKPWYTDLVRSHVSPATGCLQQLWWALQPEVCRLRWCTAEPACCLLAAKSGSGLRDGSFLSLLSVGRIFLHPIGTSADGRLARPPLASQLVHSLETIRTMFGRLRRPSRRRSSTVKCPSRAASRIAF